MGPSQSMPDSIRTAILDLDNVTQAQVFENALGYAAKPFDTSTLYLDPHSVHAIVEGGDQFDIATAIYLRKSAGATMMGTVEETVYDSQNHPHVVKFSRPTSVNVYVVVNTYDRTGFPVDGADQIKQALLDWANDSTNVQIGGGEGHTLEIQQVLLVALSIPGHDIDTLYIGTSPAPTGTIDIPIQYNQLAKLALSRITVNVL